MIMSFDHYFVPNKKISGAKVTFFFGCKNRPRLFNKFGKKST